MAYVREAQLGQWLYELGLSGWLSQPPGQSPGKVKVEGSPSFEVNQSEGRKAALPPVAAAVVPGGSVEGCPQDAFRWQKR